MQVNHNRLNRFLSRNRLIIFVLLAISLSLIANTGRVFAHSPLFPKENHSFTSAYEIGDPAKSWATYTSLDHTDKGDYYQFSLSTGERIVVSLFTSESPATSGFLPSFALLIPDLVKQDTVPSYVEVPDDYGVVVVSGTDPGLASFEPFTPGWLYEVAELDIKAPSDGIYYIVVFDYAQNTGNYALPIGFLEEWIPTEIISLQYNLRQIYSWEGQNPFVAALPIIITLIIGSIVFYWCNKRGQDPRGLSKWLAAFAGLAFIGSAADRVNQTLLSLGLTGIHREAAISFIFVVISIIFGVLVLRYALRNDMRLTKRRRIILIVLGVVALFSWTGLYFGSALAIAAALVPSDTTKKDREVVTEAPTPISG